jgi:hypothetical protein
MPLTKLHTKPAAKRSAPPSPNRARTFAAVAAIAVVCAVSAFCFLPGKLVTLDVKNADVQEVVRSIARQSGETILVSSEAKGNVTLNVRKKSVADVLEIITAQLGGRWQELFAVSDSANAIEALKKYFVEGGELSGWRIRGFGWGAADGDEFDWIPMPEKITYETAAKSAREVALALSLRMRSRVLVSDSVGDRTVTISLKDKTPASAVDDFARQLNARTERFYFLQPPSARRGAPPEMARGGGGDIFIPDGANSATQPFRGRVGNPQGTNRGGDGGGFRPRHTGTASAETEPASTAAPLTGTATTLDSPPNRGGLFASMTEADRERLRAERQIIAAERESAWQARLDAMPPEQRARAEQLRNALRDFRQNARTMTRDQRAEAMRGIVQKFPEIVDKRLERSIERIKNTTPEQRAERAQTLFERQKAREQREQSQQPPPQIPPSR